MSKKTGKAPSKTPASEEKAATLKDLLSADVVKRLKEQADQLKSDEEKRREDKRKQEEAARKAEQKRLENDFEYLLNHSSMEWKKFK